MNNLAYLKLYQFFLEMQTRRPRYHPGFDPQVCPFPVSIPKIVTTSACQLIKLVATILLQVKVM